MARDRSFDAVCAALVGELRRRPPTCGGARLLAVDGGAASGKSGLAAATVASLTEAGCSAAVVHTDDLLDGWDGQFTFWARLRSEVLAPLADGRVGRYQSYAWDAGRFDGRVESPVVDVLVVEGVSAIAACGPNATLRVLLQVPRGVRERRWSRRDGQPLQPEWQRWLDREDSFFASCPAHPDAILRWPDPRLQWTTPATSTGSGSTR